MKKISLMLFAAFVFAGCSLGFNQNVAQIDGKQYLISTPTYAGPLMMGQWEGKSKITALDAEQLSKEAVAQQIQDFIKSCRLKNKRDLSYNYEGFFNCVNNKE